MSLINWSLKDFLIGSLITAPPLLLAVAILTISQKYIARVFVDIEYGVLIIKRKGCVDEEHELLRISQFILKELRYPMPGFKQFIISAEKDNGSFITLFSDDIVLFGRQWNRFSKKLATVTDKPLKREYLVEKLNGEFDER